MEPDDGVRNTKMREMRAEVVTKDDGRYLIYYSWPESQDEPPGHEHAAGAEPDVPRQEPWSPETGASDV